MLQSPNQFQPAQYQGLGPMAFPQRPEDRMDRGRQVGHKGLPLPWHCWAASVLPYCTSGTKPLPSSDTPSTPQPPAARLPQAKLPTPPLPSSWALSLEILQLCPVVLLSSVYRVISLSWKST